MQPNMYEQEEAWRTLIKHLQNPPWTILNHHCHWISLQHRSTASVRIQIWLEQEEANTNESWRTSYLDATYAQSKEMVQIEALNTV